jgi:3-oxoacyl-[acyl-carrier protein] reductase
MSTRVILITGANGDLGIAIAQAFLDESPENFVCLAVNAHRDHAQKLVSASPARCRLVALDVTLPASWQAAAREILATHGRLDVLVNNAGCHEDVFLAQMPAAAWSRVLAVNLDAVFHGCQTVLPAMISQRSGRIINMASLSALLAPAGQANYAAAKAGVVALSQSLAKEVARLGITVNTVCPGYIDTAMLVGLDAPARQNILAKVPMRRLGRPAEVAAAVRFLACADASYITGSTLKIDGGIL